MNKHVQQAVEWFAERWENGEAMFLRKDIPKRHFSFFERGYYIVYSEVYRNWIFTGYGLAVVGKYHHNKNMAEIVCRTICGERHA